MSKLICKVRRSDGPRSEFLTECREPAKFTIPDLDDLPVCGECVSWYRDHNYDVVHTTEGGVSSGDSGE